MAGGPLCFSGCEAILRKAGAGISRDALSLQERAAVQKLVRAENADRERMFKEIAAATGTDLSQLPRIRSTYAATLRQKARTGDWIQMPDASWRQK